MVEKLLLLFIGLGLIAFCFYLFSSSDIENGKKVFTYNKLTRIIAKILLTILLVLFLYILFALFIALIVLLKYSPPIITIILVALFIVLYLYILFKLITLFLPGH